MEISTSVAISEDALLRIGGQRSLGRLKFMFFSFLWLSIKCNDMQMLITILRSSHEHAAAEPLRLFILHDISNPLLLDTGLLLVVPEDTIIVITEVRTLHEFEELLIMSDNNQLKV